MSTQDHDRLPDEQALLDHYRAHATGEPFDQPSAAVDALILAAASEALKPVRPSWSARLRGWLQRPQPYALAFGSLASMALVLGLVLKGLPQEVMMDDRELAPVLEDEAPSSKRGIEAALAPRPVVPAPAPLSPEPARSKAVVPAPLVSERQAEPPAQPQARLREQMEADSLAQGLGEPPAEALAGQAPASAAALADRALAEPADATDAAVASRAPAKPRQPPVDGEPDRSLAEVLRLQAAGEQAQADALLRALQRQYPQQDLAQRLQQLREADRPERP